MTLGENQQAIDVAFAYIKQAQSYLMSALTLHHYEHDDVFSLKSNEGDKNPSYGFDEASNRILFNVLAEYDFSCHVFSEEEHSWKTIGANPKYYVICDPFCNSFLASRTFRDAAVAICISDLAGELAICAIGDLQIRRIYYADISGAYVLENFDQNSDVATRIHVSNTKDIEEAFIVTPLLKPSRRTQVGSLRFFQQAKIVHGVDGAIMIARLAAGYIDAYLDPLKGQPLYEVPCCELIIKAGGIVTDETGHPFHLGDIISKLSTKDDTRYKIVAACNKDLHAALLTSIRYVRD